MGAKGEGLTIRTAIEGDVPVLRELFRRAALSNEGDRDLIAQHPEFLEWSGEPVERGHTRVAVDRDGRLLGFVSITTADEQPGVVEVEDLFVEPDAMRQGIGRALVDDLCERARREGIRTVVVVGNRHARDFYERIGFVFDAEVAVTGGTALRMHRDVTDHGGEDSKFVSLGQATAFLSERHGADVTDVAQLGEGYWSRAFSFRQHGRELVARFGQHREDFDKDRAAMAFGAPDAPVPDVLEVGEALGGAYAISERKHGEFLERLGTQQFQAVLPALLRALDHFRDIPLPPATPIDIVDGPSATTRDSTWGEWLLLALEDVPNGRVSGWRAKMRETPEIDELFERGGRELTGMAADCPDIRHVLHCDLINRNVLAAPDGSGIEAIFDWGCSIYGDFLYEIAGLTFWSPRYPAIEAAGLTSAIRRHYAEIGLEVPDFALRLRCCELQIGLLHLAYSTFAGDGHVGWIADRTRGVLEEAVSTR